MEYNIFKKWRTVEKSSNWLQHCYLHLILSNLLITKVKVKFLNNFRKSKEQIVSMRNFSVLFTEKTEEDLKRCHKHLWLRMSTNVDPNKRAHNRFFRSSLQAFSLMQGSPQASHVLLHRPHAFNDFSRSWFVPSLSLLLKMSALWFSSRKIVYK